MPDLIIRPLCAQDGGAAAEVFFDAVQRGTTQHYSARERNAWAGTAPNPAAWQKRLATLRGFAAEREGELLGFMTLDETGYIDLAFVRSDQAGQGIGRALYAAVEQQLRAEGASLLTVEASKTARGFFERLGWQVQTEQVVQKQGVDLTNYKMVKRLAP
jgi:putative acetyltransferase